MEQLIKGGSVLVNKKYSRSFSTLMMEVNYNFIGLYSKDLKKSVSSMVTTSGTQAVYNVIDHLILMNQKADSFHENVKETKTKTKTKKEKEKEKEKVKEKEKEKEKEKKREEPKKEIHLFFPNQIYFSTKTIVTRMKFKYGINVTCFDLEENQSKILKSIQKIPKNSCLILLFETVSNPNGNVFDFSLIKKIRKAVPNTNVVVDNTWMSGVLFNPFKYDADVVVNSTSKYYSCGKHIGGVILTTNNQLISSINNEAKVMGIHISPISLRHILDHWETLPDRVKKSSLKTKEIVKKLKPKYDLIYPFGSKLFKKFINREYGPSIFLLKVNKTAISAKEFLSNQSIINFTTSYGTSYSKINTHPFSDPKDNSKSWLRVYVGFDEDVDQFYKKILELFP
ncbi:homocysteine/cysteine synthase [Anaeramoeba flamelloides]|uniref:Homocysteine/cysteine synthase n=1 Tax=Anaeramoeba flamelloides TaxID=1746091 RepID=A0AAV8A9D8_9EUKA|nr:homocysteine/cysteine synthase [Anaeramoeba flamelloides]